MAGNPGLSASLQSIDRYLPGTVAWQKAADEVSLKSGTMVIDTDTMARDLSRRCGERHATSAKPRQHGRKLVRTDIEVFAHPPPQHRRRYVAVTTFLLRLRQDVQHHSLLASQAITNVRYFIVPNGHRILRASRPAQSALTI
jgi:hypothetical protein